MVDKLTTAWNRVEIILRWAYFVIFGVLSVGFIVLGALEVVDAANDEPVVWGTFTEQRCVTETRGGCTSYGSWVSDDGFEKFDEIMFDGTIKESGGTSRAGHQPGGLTSDVEDGIVSIVHAEEYTGILEIFFPFLAAFACIGGIWFYWGKWNDEGWSADNDDEPQPRRAA